MNFRRFGNDKVALELNHATCDVGLVYDERLQVCGYKLLQISPETGPERYYVVSWLQTTGEIGKYPSETTVQEAFLAYFQLSSGNLNVSETVRMKDFFLVKSTVILTSRQSLELRSNMFKMSNLTWSKIASFIYFETSWQIKIVNNTFTVFKTTSQPLKCYGRKIYSVDEYLILDNEKILIYATNTTFEKNEYFLEKAADGTNVPGNITVCQKHKTALCNSWKLLSLEHVEILENLSIYDNNTSSLYDYGQYEVFGNISIQICMSSYKKYATKNDLVLGWITVVCVVCLLYL